jgi:AsmA protein
LFVLAPTDLVRDELIQHVKVRSGRDLTIGGPTSFSLYPNLSIAMRDVALSAPSSMGGRPAVSIELLEARLSLWALLQRRIDIEGLVLRRPVIELRVDQEGRRTWELAGAASPAATRGGQTTLPDADWNELAPELRQFVQGSHDARKIARAKALHHPAPEPSSAVSVRIENGTVRYVNEPAGVTTEITSLQLQLGVNSIAESLEAKGSLVWREERFDLDASIASLRALLETKSSVLELSLAGRPLEAKYQGSFTLGNTPEFEGALTARSPSTSGLGRWLGLALPDSEGGPLALSAHVKTDDAAIMMSDLKLASEGTSITGSASFQIKGTRPYVMADLQISELDLERSGLLQGGPAPTDDQQPERQATYRAEPGTPSSIDDLLPQPDVSAPEANPSSKRGKDVTRRSGWDETELDLSWLGRFDADAKLEIGRLLFRDLRLGQTQLTLALKDRVLSASLDDVQLYEGRARGNLRIDTTGRVPALGAKLALTGVSALPLLKDAAGFHWISGNGTMTLAVSGQGRSERQIVESLTGTAEIAIADGAMVGINLPKIIRGLERGRIPSFDHSAADKTDFSELAASFSIENGVAQNRDLRLASPLLRAAGAGTIDISRRQLDYTLRPKPAAGQDGAQGLAGIELPVKITGSWDKPNVAADINGVVKDPQQVVDAVKRLGKQLKGKKAEEALRKLLGGSPEDGGPPQKPRELLRQLLKQQ